ncbi:MAG: hypothetical protein HC869_16005, partial [Rhodospirillales bacterium]|nr:hypothetical protein [Rhodospirillales bacterium]
MGLDQITYTGVNADRLQLAFEYLYTESTSFRNNVDEHLAANPSSKFVITSISAVDVPGVQNVTADGDVNTAPGFNITVGDTSYLGVNFGVTAKLRGPGVPADWTDYYGNELTDDEFLEVLNEIGYLDAITSFPDDPTFWINNGFRIPGYAEWSQLPNLGGSPNYYVFYKWAYYASGAVESGMTFQQFVAGPVDDWVETQAAFQAILELKNASIVTREMTIEERLGHEFAHEFILGGSLSNEKEVIEYMNSVFEALGLPLLREVPANDMAILDLVSRMADGGYSMPTILEFIRSLGLECFGAGTSILLPDGTKQIQDILPGDIVLSYDASGTLVPGRVTRTFRNEVSHLLDVHGLKVTPGHATLCGDGMFKGRHVPIIDILLSDGALVRADGTLIRMAIDAPVGSVADAFVKVAVAATPEDMRKDT